MEHTTYKLAIVAALFLLCSTKGVAQTKQESLDWFDTYGKALVNVPPDGAIYGTRKIDIRKDTLYIYGKVREVLGVNFGWEDFRVALKDIKYSDISKLAPEAEEEGYKLIKIKTQPNKASWTNKELSELGLSNDKMDHVDLWYKNEADALRIIKCIMHLAKLCGARPIKQTF